MNSNSNIRDCCIKNISFKAKLNNSKVRAVECDMPVYLLVLLRLLDKGLIDYNVPTYLIGG